MERDSSYSVGALSIREWKDCSGVATLMCLSVVAVPVFGLEETSWTNHS